MKVENIYANDFGNLRVHLQFIANKFSNIAKLDQKKFL
jgi:hypothetical protein